jgi:hypothetical protein
MKVERVGFLALTAAIAAACGASKEAMPPVMVPEASSPADASASDAAADAAAATTTVTTERDASTTTTALPRPCAEDDVGDPVAVTKAWNIDPTCESAEDVRYSVARFGDQKFFKPRVSQSLAECMARTPFVKATRCKIPDGPDWRKCIKEAVDKACIEPAMLGECERIVADCKTERKPVTFTVEQCARLASATRDLRTISLREMRGIGANGVPRKEGCTMKYAAIY